MMLVNRLMEAGSRTPIVACCGRVGDNLALSARVHPLCQQLGLLRVADAVIVWLFRHVFPLEVLTG